MTRACVKKLLGPSVNMAEEGKNKNNKQNKGKKHDFKEHSSGSGSNKKPKLECWKCGETGHFKRDCHSGFGYYNNGMFMLNLNKVLDDSDSVYMSYSSTVVNSSLWHARLGHVHYKRMLKMSKDDLIPAIDENHDKCNKKYVITFIDDASRFCYVYLLHAKDEALDKFRIYKTEVELQQNDLIKTLRTDRGDESPLCHELSATFPEEVHPQLLSSDATMHERPAGKVGMYTRFFDYANYRIPFSTFFVSVLTHFRILFSQLSVFGSAKVSHFEILCRVCNINPSVGLFRYFYTHNYKNGWFGFTKRPNVRACYSKNLDSVKNWNDHFFWVDEFVVPANARFGWFSGTNIVKDRAPAPSEYNVEHVNTLIAQASPFLRFPEEFLCWVGISRNYLLNKDTYPRFEYENGEEMDLNAFIRTTDPRKARIVERARDENERPIVTVAKHHTVTLLPTSVVRFSGELSASVEREFIGDASVGDGGDQGVASVGGQDNVEPIVPITDHVETETPVPKHTKKKRVTRGSERTPAASHPPKRLRADYGTTGGSATGGKSPSVLNRLLQDSRLMVEQGVPALLTLPFITSSVTSLPLEEGGDHTDSVTGPSLRSMATSARFVVLSDSSHHLATNSAGPEGDSFVRSVDPVMTEATTVTTIATTVAIPADVGKDKSVPRTCRLRPFLQVLVHLIGRIAPSAFLQGGQWSVTRGFELNDGRSLSSEVRMRAEYNILEKMRWKSLVEEKDNLLQVKDKEIEDLRVSPVTSLESIIAEKDRELSDLGASSSSLRSQNQSLVNQVNELETSSTDLRGKLEMYEGSMKQLEEFQDNLMKPLEARLAEIDADFTRCCMHFQENFHPHLLNAIAGRRWLLTHGMKLLMAKCLNSTEYMEALGNAFGRAIEKGMQEGLAAGIEHGQAGRCLSDLEAYNPSAEADFNSAVRDLRGLDFPLLRELFAKKDASTWDVMDLLRLDDAVAEVLGMTDLQPDVGQLMVPVHHKQDKVVIGSQALSVALETCHRRVRKMERNLAERLPLLRDVFVSIDHPVSTEALAILPETSTEPLVTALVTTALSTMVIRPNPDPFLLVEDYENLDLTGMVLADVISGFQCEGNVEGSPTGDAGDVFSHLENEAGDAVL
ncbi:gypsy type transposase [Tanacetum coccineum]